MGNHHQWIHASRKLLYSLCFLTYMKMVNTTWFYGPRTTTFAHKVFISITFVKQSFDLKMTYFRIIRATLIAISAYLEAKFDYGYFIKKYAFGFHDSTQVIPSKIEGVTAIFATLDVLKIFFQSLKFKVWTFNPTRGQRPPAGQMGPQPSAGARRMGA